MHAMPVVGCSCGESGTPVCSVPIIDSVRAGMTADLLEYAHYSLGKIMEVEFCRKNFINGIFVLFFPTLVMKGD